MDYIRRGREKLVEHCAEVMEGRLTAVEFRNSSWWTENNRESTLAFERERQLVNVVVDGPQGFSSSVPASDRFNYDYCDDEPKQIADHIKRL